MRNWKTRLGNYKGPVNKVPKVWYIKVHGENPVLMTRSEAWDLQGYNKTEVQQRNFDIELAYQAKQRTKKEKRAANGRA